jgi:hypothetical protein
MIVVKLEVDLPCARDAITADLYLDGQQVLQSTGSPELRRHRLKWEVDVFALHSAICSIEHIIIFTHHLATIVLADSPPRGCSERRCPRSKSQSTAAWIA